MRSFVYSITEIAQSTIQDHWAVKAIVAFCGAIVGFALPTEATRTTALCAMALVAFDFITALIAVMRDPKLRVESAKAARTLSKVFAYSALLAVVSITTRQIPAGPDSSNGLLGFTVMGVLGWICLTESISILENITRAGILLPPGLREWLNARIGGGKGERSFPQTETEE